MPRIILTQPFMRHYAGSVFELSDQISMLNWDDDERVRDKINFFHNQAYELPDDGKGKSTLLSLQKTMICPEHVFELSNIKCGPWRITSVSKGLEEVDELYYSTFFPGGKGKVLLKDSDDYPKNILRINLQNELQYDQVTVKNRSDGQEIDIHVDMTYGFELDGSPLHPGFYLVDLILDGQVLDSFTAIKCFPLVVHLDKYSGITISKTLW